MGIVRFALKFPHTFYVLAAFIIFIGVTAIRTMPMDIFPEINIPVVTIIWQYDGLSTPEMEQRVTTYSQYSISANVSGIKDMEAQTLNGLSVIKIYFQPEVDIDLAIAQVVSASNSIRAYMPPGIQPPIVVQYNASSVPVLQLSLTSETLDQAQLYNYGIYTLRQQLAPVQGVTFPTPDGGKPRQIMVDIDPKKLLAKGLTPNDIVNAVNAQSLTLPSGDAKIGNIDYTIRTNSMAPSIEALNNLPVKYVNNQTVFVRDIGHVRDGSAVQQNVVRENGQEAVLLSVIKNGNASTVAVVNGVLAALEIARESAPPGLSINELFDQSTFVTSAIEDVVREGLIAAGLTALMILLFLGSWRSTLVVMISIPLAILTSIIGLFLTGHTLNTMTLGGLALAVGILVDDSTVTIENTHRLLEEEHKPLHEATLYGSAGIAVPTLVSTLSISCVFASVIFLEGPPKYLFAPLGLAVVLAMLASYGLSRTLTPITIGLLLHSEIAHKSKGGPRGFLGRFNQRFEAGFEHMRQGYALLLHALLARQYILPVVAVLLLALGATLYMFVGRDFYPVVDAGQIKLHVRAPPATRLEETVKIFHAVEDKIREVIPEKELALVVDDIGVPANAYNLAFTDGSTINTNDGVILVSLNPGHAPTEDYVKRLRVVLAEAFPSSIFYFQAADMVTQILNFGLAAQIDVRTVGPDVATNLKIAKELRRRMAAVPGLVDVHIQQEVNAPSFVAKIDRSRALQVGLTAESISNNLNISLASSRQVTPNFWTDPKSGIPYYFAVQTPQYWLSSLGEMQNTPVSTSQAQNNSYETGVPVPGMMSNIATFKRESTPTNLNQTNVQPVFEVYAGVEGRDLGTVSDAISQIVKELQPQLKPGNTIQVLGQIASMDAAFTDLIIGLLFASVLVYLLMVVNYQNFGEPFVVILALPATFVGILTMLFVTGTTLSVPSLMGAIMAVGVASANSILLVTFASEQQLAGKTSVEAAIEAGHTRIRPVLMTASAMIVGMIPMAIGGPGAEQNAVLARAVIGGLLFATPTTLLLVPFLFAVLRKGNDGKPAHGVFEEITDEH
jgi:multidrug efflux pump subunit AcrB